MEYRKSEDFFIEWTMASHAAFKLKNVGKTIPV